MLNAKSRLSKIALHRHLTRVGLDREDGRKGRKRQGGEFNVEMVLQGQCGVRIPKRSEESPRSPAPLRPRRSAARRAAVPAPLGRHPVAFVAKGV